MQTSDTATRLFAVQQLNNTVILLLFNRVTNKEHYTVDIQNTNDAQIIRGGFFSADWS